MKKLLLLATAIAAFVLPTATQAQMIINGIDNFYVGVQAGANFNRLNFGKRTRVYTDTGYLVNGSIGVRTNCNVRIEGEVGYRRSCLDEISIRYRNFRHNQKIGGYISSLSFMTNAFYDLPVPFCIQPYVGAGVGYARNHLTTSLKFEKERTKSTHAKNGIAWQAIGGLAVPLDMLSCCGFNGANATLEYRYFKPNVRHCWNHSVSLGLRVPM